MFGQRARRALSGSRFGDVRWFDEVDSTNTWLLDEARNGAPEGVVAVADHQTAGRGRLGRAWIAPPGASLLMSILFRPRLEARSLHVLSLLVALAAGDECAARGAPVAQKWPNDLYVGERKLAGILAESIIGSGQPAVVVGIGINVAWPDDLPAEIADRATALNHQGVVVDREDLMIGILSRVDERYDDLSGVAADYARRCATVGTDVRVDLGRDGEITGRAVDLDADGALILDTESGRRFVTVGDVTSLRPS